jgi:hypothetical protein
MSSARTAGTTAVSRSSIERRIACCGCAPPDICIRALVRERFVLNENLRDRFIRRPESEMAARGPRPRSNCALVSGGAATQLHRIENLRTAYSKYSSIARTLPFYFLLDSSGRKH